MRWLINFWYNTNHPLSFLFLPIHALLYLLVSLRRGLYQVGIFKSHKISVPVIIVGNITVGGTGKSPLVMKLAEQLSEKGYQVGVLSRGYGGQTDEYPKFVKTNSSVTEVGDEPLMIKRRLDVVVVVDPDRVRGAQYLVSQGNCDVIICDDGLQHYRLQRDIELLVIDGERNLGNKLLLPFGPLREPISRVGTVDAVVTNELRSSILNNNKNKIWNQKTKRVDNHFSMLLRSHQFVAVDANVGNGQAKLNIKEFINLCAQQSNTINGIAAIGNPERFFSHLAMMGLKSQNHHFDDHHFFTEEDFSDMKGIIIMTEKDAVKCSNFATDKMWYLAVDADLTPSICDFCLALLKTEKGQS